MPVYNEKDYFEKILKLVFDQNLPFKYEVIVVDSGSTDGTSEIINTLSNQFNFKKIFLHKNKGKGFCVRKALSVAKGQIILIQDADLEYDPADYLKILEVFKKTETTLVIGSRYLQKKTWKIRSHTNAPIYMWIVNLSSHLLNNFFNLIFSTQITDTQSMFKVFLKKNIDGLNFMCDGFDFDTELLSSMIMRGHKPSEVAVSYNCRSVSEGKKLKIFKDGLLVLFTMIRVRLNIA